MYFLHSLALFALSAPGVHSLVTPHSPSADLLLARSLGGSGSSSSLVERDFDTAKGVIDDIAAGFSTLKDAADVFNGDSGPLKAAAQDLLDTIDADTAKLQAMAPLSFNDCYYLVTPLKMLQKQADALEATLEGRKSEVEAAKECGTVFGFLDQGVQKSGVVMSTIKSKAPDNAKAIVQQQGDKLIQQLQGVRDFFASGNCVNAA